MCIRDRQSTWDAVSDALYDLHLRVSDAFMDFIGSGLRQFKIEMPGSQFNEKNFQAARVVADFVSDTFYALSLSTRAGFTIAAVIASVIYFFTFWVHLMSFKKYVIQMRKGEWPLLRGQAGINDGSNYVGFAIANTTVSFVLLLIVLGSIFTVLCWPMFWDMLWNNILVIVGILVLPIIKSILTSLSKKFLCDNVNGIKHRRLWSIYELVMLYVNVGAGISASIMRIVMLSVIGIVGLTRLDASLFPEWLNKYAYLDGGAKSFMGMCFVYHLHNNPVVITAALLLRKSLEKWKDLSEEDRAGRIRKMRVVQKLWLGLILTKNPELQGHRKKEIAKRKEEEANQKLGDSKKKVHSSSRVVDLNMKANGATKQPVVSNDLKLMPLDDDNPQGKQKY
eukprot:TRINITY_DN6619_c0_g1_i1.p1 TRINITY_DN6619_c0_g1~~TRINITY_DN6619_c0_g1_i1.p1  ORF type:complete len:394 (-),score=94.53 TRINITY_DN6619_c0_g1_i1:175-1356(-)